MVKRNTNIFFQGDFFRSKKYFENIKKTKNIYNSLLLEIKNYEIPLFKSFDKDYKLNFSEETIKKFSKSKNIIIFGMGGSILGAKSIYSFLRNNIKKKIFFFDNLDSNLHREYKKIKNLKNSCFIVVSKSGNTLETITNLSTVFSKKIFKKKLIIITEMKDSILMDLANKFDAEIIEHNEFIGGRYSVLSESAMFPASMMGFKTNKFKNFKKLIKNKKFVSSLIKNVAGIYTMYSKKINNSFILSYDSSLNDLGYWYQQLVAESLGKEGKGINPTVSYCPRDNHSLLQLYLDGPKDKFFTFFSTLENKEKFKLKSDIFSKKANFLKNKNLDSIISAQCEATKNIFRLKNIPYRHIIFKNRNEEELGKFFLFSFFETILLSRLINVNPFDQPSVEDVKIETKNYLR